MANSYYQGLVQNLYGGSKGCFVCFMQFFYQYVLASVKNPDFACCFERLFQKELQNCQILGGILLEIGGENKFFASSKKYLSASCVNYQTDIKEIFTADIELFEINIIDLKNAINKIDSLDIKAMLKKVLKNKKDELCFLKEFYFKKFLLE